jgi:TolA-binding protein
MTREQIREGTSAGTERQVEINQAQVKKADQQAMIDVMEENLRNLQGQVEYVQNKLNKIEMEKAESQTAIDSQAPPLSPEEVKQKFLVFEEALRAMELKLGTLTEEVKKLRSRPAAKSSRAQAKSELGNYAGAQKAFSKKSWKKAIVGYEKYRELNPKGRQYADATYKIGVCFQELGMKAEAKAFYEEVIAKFPKGKTAKSAKYRLSQVQ